MLRIPQVKAQAQILRTMFAENGVTLTGRQALDAVARINGHKNYQVLQKLSQEPGPSKTSRAYDPSRQIVEIWSIGDVQSVRPDLTDKQALEVLHKAQSNADADVGINYGSLTSAARIFTKWRIVAELIDGDDVPQTVTVDLSNGSVFRGSPEALEAKGIYWESEAISGELRFSTRPDVAFEVDLGAILNGGTESLFSLCEDLRQAEATH